MNPICRDVSRSVFDEEIILMKYDVSIDKELFGVYSEIRLGILRFHADVKAPDDHFWDYMNTEVLPQVRMCRDQCYFQNNRLQQECPLQSL